MIYVVLAVSIAAMAGIAIWAYRNVAPDADRLPMQWSVRGAINWRAPRLIAVAVTPLLMLTLIVVIFIFSRDNHSERNMALLWISFLGPALQALHMALVARTAENEE
ncbi:MAG: hypothetical protein ABS40_00880 [Agrobacterium sp. SCN 61-19]|nr:MAG: hypothetical protein ABS40_00880 [Agrobacterium sp. SCN 61-19]